MSLLVNLNQKGFLTIKNDRSKIQNKIDDLTMEIGLLQKDIEELNLMKREFDDAYERLKDFYEPTIKIRRFKLKDIEYYEGRVNFKYPERSFIHTVLGKVTAFKGDNDPRLVSLAEEKIKGLIKEIFPIYF